jgi:hypothetical protein
MFYDYADSGSWTESTYRANEANHGILGLNCEGIFLLFVSKSSTTISLTPG